MPRKKPRAAGRTLPGEAAIRALAGPEVFLRGQEYRRRGAVESLVARGDAIKAEVAGSAPEPYRVTLRIAEGRITQTACTCPYEWGGACKHVIAALLTLADAPARLEERPSLAQTLEPLDRAALAALVLRRAAVDPDFAGRIAGLIERHKRKYKLRPLLEALRFGA